MNILDEYHEHEHIVGIDLANGTDRTVKTGCNALPIVIAPYQSRFTSEQEEVFKRHSLSFGGSYELGWLVQGYGDPAFLEWGNAKDKESAIEAAEETIAKQGKREVYFSDRPLGDRLDRDTVKWLKAECRLIL